MEYTTQMDAARKGIVTPELKTVAKKEYISGALESMLDLGHGSGPLNHTWCFEGF